ncbi:MAG: hypothetical protein SGJ21_14570 [Alphaproteobacteria bacterium]|nr:hypothetical protein [Alphaproteobacteria bacterium]
MSGQRLSAAEALIFGELIFPAGDLGGSGGTEKTTSAGKTNDKTLIDDDGSEASEKSCHLLRFRPILAELQTGIPCAHP